MPRIVYAFISTMGFLLLAGALPSVAHSEENWPTQQATGSDALERYAAGEGPPPMDQMFSVGKRKYLFAGVISAFSLLLMPLFGFRISSALIMIAITWGVVIFIPNPNVFLLITAPLGLCVYFFTKSESR